MSRLSDSPMIVRPTFGCKPVSNASSSGYGCVCAGYGCVCASTALICPGAITQSEFEALDPSAYAGKTLVPYCTIGYRSGEYARKLMKRGGRGEGCTVLNGAGVVEWTHSSGGESLVTGPASAPTQTKQVHVFGPKWDLLREDYTSVTDFRSWKLAMIAKIAR